MEHGEGREGRGAGENNGQEKEPRFCFTSRKVQSGADSGGNKYIYPGVEETVSDTETSGEGAAELPLSCRKMELPAAGEHVFAVESIEKKRSRKVGGHKSVEGRFLRSKHADRGSTDSARR